VCRRSRTSYRQKHKRTANSGRLPRRHSFHGPSWRWRWTPQARASTSVYFRWELPGRFFDQSVLIRSVAFLGHPDSNMELAPALRRPQRRQYPVLGMKALHPERRKSVLAVKHDGPPSSFNRPLMSLSSYMWLNGIGILFWSLLEVWFHGGRGCVFCHQLSYP
jgi:hypothetical protein